jgi:AraC family transcriptional regulator, activator of mtrCDE
LNVAKSRLYAESSHPRHFQEIAMDWLSRLFEMMPVRGRLDLRCSYGAPWRIDQGPGEVNEIPYHAVVSGSAVLEDPAGGKPLQLRAGDILLLPGNPRHVMHDGSGARAKPVRGQNRSAITNTSIL